MSVESSAVTLTQKCWKELIGIGQLPPLSSLGFVKSHWVGTTITSFRDASPAAAKSTVGAAISLKAAAVRPMEHGAYVNLAVAPLTAAFPRLRLRPRKRFTIHRCSSSALGALSPPQISAG